MVACELGSPQVGSLRGGESPTTMLTLIVLQKSGVRSHKHSKWRLFLVAAIAPRGPHEACWRLCYAKV